MEKIRTWFFQNYFRISRPMTLGARVIAINENNEICLVKHTYNPGWHLPGGGVEKGESVYETAIKELMEEAGLVVAMEDLELVSMHANFHNFKGDHVVIFRAKKWEISHTHRPHEIAECQFFPLDALPKDTTKGTIKRIEEATGHKTISHHW